MIQQQALEKALQEMVEQRDAYLSQPGLSKSKRAVLTSLREHHDGLTVFVKYPQVHMDNNISERAARKAAIGRNVLSREVCERFNWRKENGSLKDMSARVAMLRMQDDGLIKLPPPRSIQRNKITIPFTSATEPGIERREPVHALAALELQLVSKVHHSKLWNEYMHRYHYRPVLLETFVEKDRFQGTCYKAANWQLLGQTKGRGRLGKPGVISTPIKDIWVYPLQLQLKPEKRMSPMGRPNIYVLEKP